MTLLISSKVLTDVQCTITNILLSQMEESELRGWIEKLQVRLQTSTIDSPQQLQAVQESVVVKKQGLCETLQSWNNR